jgi:L-threonylcarbamoyladenylate synthase
MNTKIYDMNNKSMNMDDIMEIGKILRDGGTVVFPTETVYGLGANALDQVAVESIFTAKGRPSDNPLIVHISSMEQLGSIVDQIPEKARMLIDNFWPGALTLVFEKKKTVPDRITAGLSTVAVRMPDSEIALALIEAAGVPLAAPSANISGKPSPTSVVHVIEDLDGRVDAIIDGGDCHYGVESTVIDVLNDPPMILRPGGVTIEQISRVIDSVVYDPALDYYASDMIPRSPGQKYRHYSPKGQVILFIGQSEYIYPEIIRETKRKLSKSLRTMILCTDENIGRYSEGIIFSLGSRTKPEEISSNLFRMLRKADELDMDAILVEGIEENNIGAAVMNRLRKASGGRIIKCGD